MENTTAKNDLVLDVHEVPAKKSQWALLSIQHILAMFVACITVPLIIGTSIPATIISAGVGTLIYILLTKQKSPVVLSSSFAYLSAMAIVFNLGGGNNYLALAIGMTLVGLVYVAVALVVKKVGTGWLFKLLPTIVVGPVIMVIGLGLSGSAINNLTGAAVGTYNLLYILCGVVALFVTAIAAYYGKKTISLIPFVIGMGAGYLLALIITLIGYYACDWEYAQIINFAPIVENFKDIKVSSFIGYDCFGFLDWGANAKTWEWSHLLTIVLAVVPVSFVTICEHIGDHLNLGGVIHKDLLKDPGLDRTLMGDGIATAVSGWLCGCANTTYGENVAVVGVTKVASVKVITTACIATIALGLFTPLMVVVQTIPACVTGGVSLALYGFIASSGVKMLINEKVDFSESRNIFIAASILVAGIGGLTIQFKVAGEMVTITSTAIAMILGIVLNVVLKEKKAEATEEVVAEETAAEIE